MHLEHAPGLGADGVGVVAQVGPVGRADLAQPRPGRGDEVGQAEAVADLDHLAARDHDLARGGEGGRREDERGGAVVDRKCPSGVGHGLEECSQRPRTPSATRPGRQVHFDVDIAGRIDDGLDRAGGEGRSPDIGVHDHPGRVEHWGERRGPRRERCQRRTGHLDRRDLAGPRPLLGRGDRRAHHRPPEALRRRDEGRIRQQRVGAGDRPARVFAHGRCSLRRAWWS